MNSIKKKDPHIYKSSLLKRLKLITNFINNALKKLEINKQSGTNSLKNDIINNKSLIIIINIKYTLIKSVNESNSPFHINTIRI